MILIDTHVLVWVVQEPDKIGDNAREMLRAATINEAVYIAAISVLEISTAAVRGRLQLTMPTRKWVDTIFARPGFRLAALDAAIAVDAGQLPDPIHGDPADRLIIATARALDCPLLTADRKILAYAEAGYLRATDARR